MDDIMNVPAGGQGMRSPGERRPEEPIDEVDLRLLEGIARIHEAIDPVPDGLVERSLFAVTLAGLEAEVMRLEYVQVPATAVRGDRPPVEARTITFTSENLTVMITLSRRDGKKVRVDGWAAPAMTLHVELHRPDGMVETTTDEDGRFVFEAVAAGPASLLIRRPDGTGEVVSTPVLEL